MTASPTEYPDLADYLETAPLAFYAVRADDRTVAWANAAARRLADPPATVTGTPFRDLFDVADGPVLAALLSAAPSSADASPAVATARVRTPSGARSTHLSANVGRDGTVRVAAVMSESDRSRDRALDDALSDRSAAAAALSRSRDALVASERARASENLEGAQVRSLATVLQRTLLPPVLASPPGMQTAAYYHHASPDEVGGDFYDVFPLDGEAWGFFLGDVSGKGAGAAAVTSLTRYTLRAAAVFDRDPISVLQNLNAVLLPEFRGDDPRFCTVVYGTVVPSAEGAVIDLAGGGHPPPLHVRGDGTARYVDDLLGGQLVGGLPTPHFTSHRLVLSPGDVLLLYSDGVTEARVAGGRYDDDGDLLTFVADSAPTTATDLVDRVTTLVDGFGEGLQDDAALLALGMPRGASSDR
ncbi:PP2C family protein-serine/threonine phosphatase [Rhodococcoides corynebacterioides]|uniref:PP2C family protein-serine/threonine phosphatase n=1 Tax=Rhodococcoides corynebacterioides TaxID=53972 RepID=UPI000AABB780|nr:PP2C family protein-serine/threonine phosphatase [Rhodococcus corynebacterioides]